MPKGTETTTKFKVDISDFKKAMQEANRAIRLANSEFKSASDGTKQWAKSTDGLTAKISQLNKVMDAEQRKLDILENEYKQVADAQGKDSKEAQELQIKINNQIGVINRAEASLDKYEKELKDGANAEDKLTKETKQNSDTMGKASQSFSTAKVALGNLVAQGVKFAIKEFAQLTKEVKKLYQEFDEGRDNVVKATGATGQEAKELEKNYANVAKSVKGSFSDLGSALGEVSTRFGFTGDELEKATEEFVKFADITGTDGKTAVQLVSRAMGDAGIKSSEYSSILDALTVASQKSGISVDKLTENLTKFGAPMRALGFDTKESIALFSAWEKAGVNTSIAFSGMKKAISNWSKDGKDSREEFSKTLDEIKKAPDIAQATQKAIEVFGAKAGPDLADAIQNGKFEYQDFIDAVDKSKGSLKSTYEETMDAGDKIELAWQKSKTSVAEFASKLVDEYGPQIEKGLNTIIDDPNKIGEVIVGWATELIPKILELAKNIVYQLVDGIKKNKDKLVEVVQFLATQLPEIANQLLPILLQTGMQLATDLIKGIAQKAPEIVKSAIVLILDFCNTLLNNIDDVVDAGIELVMGLADGLIEGLPILIDKLPEIIDKVLTALTNNLPKLQAMGVKLIIKLGVGMIKAIPNLIANVPKLIGSLIGSIANFAGKMIEQGKKVGGWVVDGIKDAWNKIVDVGKNLITGLWNGISNKVKWIKDKIKSFCSGVLDGIKSFFGIKSPSRVMRDEVGKQLANGLVIGFTKQLADSEKIIVKSAKNLLKAVKKELKNVSNYEFSTAGSNAKNTFTNAISEQVKYLEDKIAYQNEQKIKKYDAKIEAYNKKVTALEKKEQKTKDKKEKELIKAEIKKYKKLISKTTKAKEDYQKASSEALSAYNDAMNEYQSQAQKLIDDTINGITDKYQTRYNNLLNAQNALIDKLKNAGDLFNISGANVITISDIKAQTQQIKDYADKLATIKKKVSADLFDKIASYDMEQGSAFIDQLLSMSDSELKAYSQAYDEKMAVSEQLAENLYKSDFEKIEKDYEKEINKAFKDLPKQLEQIGKNVMQGFIDGLTKNTDYMSKGVKGFVKSIVKQIKTELKIKSPSRVTMALGEFTGEGFGEGLAKTINYVKQKASLLANSVAQPLDDFHASIGTVQGVTSTPMTSTSVVNNYNLVQNNTSPKALSALETYRARRQQVAIVKAMTGGG